MCLVLRCWSWSLRLLLNLNALACMWVNCIHILKLLPPLSFCYSLWGCCLKFQAIRGSVQFSHVWLIVTPWTAEPQASLSITNSWSSPKLMSIELVTPSKHLIVCHPLLPPSIFPSIRGFSTESVLCIRWPNIGVSVSASTLPMNIQD